MWQRLNPYTKLFLIALLLSGAAIYTLSTFDTNEKYLQLFYNSALVGGFLSGSLHALTGPDHMAAVLPLIFGKRWWNSCWQGAIWGLGHGFTSAMLGFLSYTMKSFIVETRYFFEAYGYVVDCVVGATLIIIGGMGLHEAGVDFVRCNSKDSRGNDAKEEPYLLLAEGDMEAQLLDGNTSESLSTTSEALAKISTNSNKEMATFEMDIETDFNLQLRSQLQRKVLSLLTVLTNGAILGLSWDGLPSLAPAMVLEELPLVRFLIAYLVGTFVMMAFAAALVGEATCWINKVAKVAYFYYILNTQYLCILNNNYYFGAVLVILSEPSYP